MQKPFDKDKIHPELNLNRLIMLQTHFLQEKKNSEKQVRISLSPHAHNTKLLFFKYRLQPRSNAHTLQSNNLLNSAEGWFHFSHSIKLEFKNKTQLVKQIWLGNTAGVTNFKMERPFLGVGEGLWRTEIVLVQKIMLFWWGSLQDVLHLCF